MKESKNSNHTDAGVEEEKQTKQKKHEEEEQAHDPTQKGSPGNK